MSTKLKLDVDALKVESFETRAPDGGGTVFGHASQNWSECAGTCPRQTDANCLYPTAAHHSCPPGWTDDDFSCRCLYPDTDVRMCCSEFACTGGGMC